MPTKLSAADRQKLITRFRISKTVEQAAQLRRLSDEEARKVFSIGDKGDMSGIGFVGHDLTGAERVLTVSGSITSLTASTARSPVARTVTSTVYPALPS